MATHPNNTLAKYITNLPRRISLSGDWECGLTEIHYPHDWYNVRNARLTIEQDGNVETDAYFEDSYYDSPKALAKKLNGDKPGRVKFSYEPVTQKFVANVRRSCPEGAWGWKFVQWSPPNGCPLIRRGAIALGKRALTTGAQIAGDVVAGKNVKKAA